MGVSVKCRLLAVAVVVCFGLLAGPAQAVSVHKDGGFGGWTVAEQGTNTTFFTSLGGGDYYSIGYSNGSNQYISGDAEHSGSYELLFTADSGWKFTNVSVGIYGYYHVSSVGTPWVYVWNSLSLDGGSTYGPNIYDRKDTTGGSNTGYGNSEGAWWPNISVNASSFTVNFTDYLKSVGEGDSGAAASSVTPAYMWVAVNLTEAPVPLPSALLLLGSGLAGLAGWRRFRQG